MVVFGRNSLVYQAPARSAGGSPSPAASASAASIGSPQVSSAHSTSPSSRSSNSILSKHSVSVRSSPNELRPSSRDPPRAPATVKSDPPPVLHVFGDSFCQVFSLLGSDVAIHKFTGASARGLNNHQSMLQVGPEIVRRIERLRPQYVLLQFGNTDLHINYLWQLKARGANALRPGEFVNFVANEFCRYVENHLLPLAASTGVKFYVAGALPPVVEDPYLELAAAKYIQKSSSTYLPSLTQSAYPSDLLTRRSLVKLYNRLLSQFCARHPTCLSFVTINHQLSSSSSSSSSRESDRVSSEYVDSLDPTNIHLIWERTIQHWCRQVPILRRFLPRLEREAGRIEAGLALYEREKLWKMERDRKGKGLRVGLGTGRDKSPLVVGGNGSR